jgi:hypothetical protein
MSSRYKQRTVSDWRARNGNARSGTQTPALRLPMKPLKVRKPAAKRGA